MSNLYQDAILDAKALRASAMANAKAALEEAFEPKIQEMISKHLAEEAVEEQVEEGYGMEEEGYNEEGKMHGKDHEKMEEADINEAELEEILNQLEEMESSEALNEAEEEEEEEEDEEEVEAAEETEEVSDETKVIDITLGDLKQVIQSLMPGEAMPAAEEPTADSEAEAEVSLEEILAELEHDGEESVHNVSSVEEGDTGYSHGKQSHATEEGMKHDMEEASNLDEMIFGGGEAVLIPTLIGIIGAIITMIGAGVIVHKRQQSKDTMKEQEGEDVKASLLNLKKSLETGAMTGSDALKKLKGMLDVNAVIKGFKSKFPVLGAAASKLFGSTVKEEVGVASEAPLLTPDEQTQLASAIKNAAEEQMNEIDLSDAAVQQAVNDAIGFIKMGGTDMIKNIASMTPAALGVLTAAIGGGILSPKIKAKLQPVIDKIRGKAGVTEELEEAKATIETLRKDLQEVNLLNAKYLYMNKLFKSKSLTETQKLKVINTLDRATSVKEVKTAYELMKESFSVNKGQLKESVGFASKPAGVAPKANIVEADQFINRWQKLAGIKK